MWPRKNFTRSSYCRITFTEQRSWSKQWQCVSSAFAKHSPLKLWRQQCCKENRLQGQIPSSCIVVVVSPLTALMVDQVAMFKNRGLQAAFVGKEQTDERIRQQVEKGVFSLVFMSPESLLKVLRWREMFRSKIYQDNLVGLIVDEAHCVEKWWVYYILYCSHLANPKQLQHLSFTQKQSMLWLLRYGQWHVGVLRVANCRMP